MQKDSSSQKPDYSTYPSLNLAQRRAAAERLLAMRGRGALASPIELAQVEAFYNAEARLLDEERYDEWYALLADDLFYWMPLRENRFRKDSRPEISAMNMAFFDEDKADIAVRLGRLSSGLVWTDDPPTRHVYVISNVELFDTNIKGEFEAHSVFVQYRNRSEHDTAVLAGRRRDLLRSVGAGYQIVNRLMLLPQSVLLTKNLTVFF
jgi:ethylbenzene dioxygenase subunit beta